jgi:hypothetical protein
MNVVACYPRSMSAWLSNFITVPNQSLYAHDILSFPNTMEALKNVPYRYKGVVDTAATIDNIPKGHLTVIDNDIEIVREKTKNLVGTDAAIDHRIEEIEKLKKVGKVLHMENMDEWIERFFTFHTGLQMDWTRYRMLKNLNIQSQFARFLSGE